jgi:hypothetical protein
MAAAQRKRWAAARKTKAAATPAPANAAKRKRRLIPEGRARIIAATKSPSAAVRKAKAALKSPTPEKATPAAAKPGLKSGPNKRHQEFKVGGRAAEDGWPDEGGAEATGRGESARRAGCGTGDGGRGGGVRAGRRGGIADRCGIARGGASHNAVWGPFGPERFCGTAPGGFVESEQPER